jgi:hypothetical protein
VSDDAARPLTIAELTARLRVRESWIRDTMCARSLVLVRGKLTPHVVEVLTLARQMEQKRTAEASS